MQALYIFKPSTNISTIKSTKIKHYRYLHWGTQRMRIMYWHLPWISDDSHVKLLNRLSVTFLKALTKLLNVTRYQQSVSNPMHSVMNSWTEKYKSIWEDWKQRIFPKRKTTKQTRKPTQNLHQRKRSPVKQKSHSPSKQFEANKQKTTPPPCDLPFLVPRR